MSSSAVSVAAKPQVFISHKHSDAEIAQALASAIRKWTGAGVRIFLSSSGIDQRPEAGRRLNEQLQKALAESDLLILVYTTADLDWSYCLWECGVAMSPNSPETRIVVLQCGDESPAIFDELAKTKLSDPLGISNLFTDMFTKTGYFRTLHGPLTGLNNNECADAASELKTKLLEIVKKAGKPKSWAPWPSLTVAVRDSDLAELRGLNASAAREAIAAKAVIVDHHPHAPRLFGLSRIDSNAPLSDLASPAGGSKAWFDSCCAQILELASNRDPVIRAVSVAPAGSEIAYTPVVTRSEILPRKMHTEFEIAFFGLSDPRGIVVESKMLPSTILYKVEDELDGGKLLRELISAAKQSPNPTRLLVLDSEQRARGIVHKSAIEQFRLKRMDDGLADPTLSDIAKDAEAAARMKAFCVVGRNSTIADARAACRAVPHCQDVFVTETGDAEEPVIGYIPAQRIGYVLDE